jgi:hypothetical protein
MGLEVINKKIVSYCEIPQELTKKHWLTENSCDTFIEFQLEVEGVDEVSDWIRKEYPELIGEEFMIHLDW